VNTCADNLRSSEKLSFGGKRSVTVCEKPEMPDGTIASTPSLVTKPVSYSVQKNDEAQSGARAQGVKLAVVVGFKTSSPLDENAQKEFISRFDADCGQPTELIFSRSRFSGTVRLALALDYRFVPIVPDILEESEATDQDLRFEAKTEGADTFVVFTQLPSEPRFYVKTKAADAKACVAAGGPIETQRECALAKRREANRAVCAAFAKRIGNGLGLVDASREAQLCAAAPVSQVTKPFPKSDDSSFSKPTANDEEFLSKATLNKKDLTQILTPACPTLKDVK
jgi:hypothetical protein